DARPYFGGRLVDARPCVGGRPGAGGEGRNGQQQGADHDERARGHRDQYKGRRKPSYLSAAAAAGLTCQSTMVTSASGWPLLEALDTPRRGLRLRLLSGRLHITAEVDRALVGVDADARERAPLLGDEPVLHRARDDLVVVIPAEGAGSERAALEHDAEQEEGDEFT